MFERGEKNITSVVIICSAELNPLYSAQAAYSNHGYVLHS